MKLLHVSDLHFRAHWFEWVAAQAGGYDAVCLSGDLLDMFGTAKTVRENLPPLISELEKYVQQHEQAQKIQPAPSVATSPQRPSNGPRMGM